MPEFILGGIKLRPYRARRQLDGSGEKMRSFMVLMRFSFQALRSSCQLPSVRKAATAVSANRTGTTMLLRSRRRLAVMERRWA